MLGSVLVALLPVTGGLAVGYFSGRSGWRYGMMRPSWVGGDPRIA